MTSSTKIVYYSISSPKGIAGNSSKEMHKEPIDEAILTKKTKKPISLEDQVHHWSGLDIIRNAARLVKYYGWSSCKY